MSMAKRICDAAGPGEVLVLQTVKDLAGGSDITFEERGDHSLKGFLGHWSLWTVT